MRRGMPELRDVSRARLYLPAFRLLQPLRPSFPTIFYYTLGSTAHHAQVYIEGMPED